MIFTKNFAWIMKVVNTASRAKFNRIFASVYSSAHAHFLPTADNRRIAGICIDDNTIDYRL